MIHIQETAVWATRQIDLRDPNDRDDCAQDVAVFLLECEAQIQKADAPLAYARKLARNRALKFAERLKVRSALERGAGRDMDSFSTDLPHAKRVW